MSVIQCFEKSVAELDVNLSIHFRKIKTMLKVLTLHQPSDVLRYTNNSVLVQSDEILADENQIRALMRLRLDFSKEAIARMKISGNIAQK